MKKKEKIKELYPIMINPELPTKERLNAAEALDKLGWLPPDLNSWLSCPNCAKNDGNLMAMKYPVTNAQFGLFIKAGGYNEPTYWIDHETEIGQQAKQSKGWLWRINNRPKSEPLYWNDPRFGKKRAATPVVGVSWYEANAYGNWLTDLLKEISLPPELEELIKDLRGKRMAVRLPKEAEWIALAGGAQEHRFPWHPQGEVQKEIDEAEVVLHANVWESHIGQTTVVGMYPNGRSPYGLIDMAGNMWEWSYSWSNDNMHYRVHRLLRGGSWFNVARFAHIAVPYGENPHYSCRFSGFRLVAQLYTP